MQSYTAQSIEDALTRFVNVRWLGQGSEGAVFAAWDRVRRDDVALKLMPDSGDDEMRERFEHEYGLLATARSSRLVRVHDYGQVDLRMTDGSMASYYWYSMEICDSSVRKELRQLPLERRVDVGLQMLDGLAFLHAQNIAHRDIKPDNIFLNKGFQVKIGDFGIARVSSTGAQAPPGEIGMIVGSPPYLAPERWTGHQSDDWRPSDQYAAGMTLYELLSRGGAALLLGTDVQSCFRAHQSGEARPLTIPEIRWRSFSSADAVLQRMLAKRPEDRYRDIAECKREFTSALAQDDIWSGA
jgi:serine/threonine-protein kinase